MNMTSDHRLSPSVQCKYIVFHGNAVVCVCALWWLSALLFSSLRDWRRTMFCHPTNKTRTRTKSLHCSPKNSNKTLFLSLCIPAAAALSFEVQSRILFWFFLLLLYSFKLNDPSSTHKQCCIRSYLCFPDKFVHNTDTTNADTADTW